MDEKLEPNEPFVVISAEVQERWKRSTPAQKKRILQILGQQVRASHRKLEKNNDPNIFGSAPVW